MSSFLNAILHGKPKVVDVQIQNNENPKLVKNGVGVRFDIKAKITDDTFVDIEIQCRNTHDVAERAIQYLARMLIENDMKNKKNKNWKMSIFYTKSLDKPKGETLRPVCKGSARLENAYNDLKKSQ